MSKNPSNRALSCWDHKKKFVNVATYFTSFKETLAALNSKYTFKVSGIESYSVITGGNLCVFHMDCVEQELSRDEHM